MARFQLNVYADKKSKKEKPIKKNDFDSPMAARMSTEAQKAVYYEIVDNRDKRIIEIKLEE